MTNTEKIRAHLVATGHISPAEARLVHGIERLAPRICDLRDEGMEIVTTTTLDEAEHRYTRYTFSS